MIFDACRSIAWASGRGLTGEPWESRVFWAPNGTQNVHNGFTRRNISDLEHSLCLFTDILGFFFNISFSQWAATRIPGLDYGQS